MRVLLVTFVLIVLWAYPSTSSGQAAETSRAQVELPRFSAADVFALEYASDPQISPDAKRIVYVRRSANALTDGTDSRLWEVSTAGTDHRKLTDHERNESSPRWSPAGDRIVYSLSTDDGSELYVRWMATGQTARLATLAHSPRGVKWSPDGKQLAFAMHVDGQEKDADFALKMPAKPEGADWAKPARITTRLRHEADGRGYLDPGFSQLFVLPAEGGTPRQITSGPFDHGTDFAWLPDGSGLLLSANRRADREVEFRDSEIYRVALSDTSLTQLTDNYGPDGNVAVSPDGKRLAYTSNRYNRRAYQRNRLYLLDLSKAQAQPQAIAPDFDRSPTNLRWSSDGRSLYANYTDHGHNVLGRIDVGSGEVSEITRDLGGTTLGRPYTSGSYSVAKDGTVVYTHGTAQRPAEVGLVAGKGQARKLTALNDDLLPYRKLGEVREVNYASLPMRYGPDTTSPLQIQGYIVLPPDYDATRKYPLLVENHGGPILAYGPQWSSEIQLYAAHDYLVFYPNARGSTGFGEAFSDELYRAYPDRDYDDTMAGIDYLIGEGLVHSDSLYVTGGSAGGIMTAWMVGKSDRFRAAVVAKPVVNWISKTLVADNYFYYANGRYEGQPYENPMHYWKFSPISLVGNVTTPTAVLVGLNDLRTPPSEAKQLYHALKLRGVPTALVEFPGASHGIANRPSQLIQKVNHTLGWFERYRASE